MDQCQLGGTRTWDGFIFPPVALNSVKFPLPSAPEEVITLWSPEVQAGSKLPAHTLAMVSQTCARVMEVGRGGPCSPLLLPLQSLEPPSGVGVGKVGCEGRLPNSTLASTMAEPVVSVQMAAVSLGRAQHQRH